MRKRGKVERSIHPAISRQSIHAGSTGEFFREIQQSKTLLIMYQSVVLLQKTMASGMPERCLHCIHQDASSACSARPTILRKREPKKVSCNDNFWLSAENVLFMAVKR